MAGNTRKASEAKGTVTRKATGATKAAVEVAVGVVAAGVAKVAAVAGQEKRVEAERNERVFNVRVGVSTVAV